MNTFSDEDLKRLKSLYDTSESTMENKLIKGLVRRLEAAERVIQSVQMMPVEGREYDKALKSWRKSLGDGS